jgi:signal transduction histidine kinase/CheY-like chemotaxis protein
MNIAAVINKALFSEELSLSARRINVICLVGTGASLAALTSHILIMPGFFLILVKLGIVFSCLFLFYVCNRFKLYTFGIWATLISLSFVFFPLSFFMLGGANGGMTAYFVLIVVCAFLLLQGRQLPLFLVPAVFVLSSCYFAAICFPDFVRPMTRFEQAWDCIQSFCITGLFISYVILFQKRVYQAEKEKVDLRSAELGKARDQLLHREKLLTALVEGAMSLRGGEDRTSAADMTAALKEFVLSVDVDHGCLWKRESQEDELSFTPAFQWGRDRDDRRAPAAVGVAIPASLQASLARGRVFNSIVRDLPPEEMLFFKAYNALSVLIVPIFLQSGLKGLVSFVDLRRERVFTEEEVSIMYSGALMLGTELQRRETRIALEAALEEAARASRAKSEFLANMSHEIRTPMNAIFGMTTIAEKAADPERKDYCLHKIREASSHLLGVINDILDISKIEADKLELSCENFDFTAMLERTAEVFSFRIQEKHLDFSMQVGGDVPGLLYGDAQRLAQVITNLLGNAIKFTPEYGAIQLEARLVDEEDGQCVLRFSVRDSGIGITEEQRTRLFNAFEQADNSTTRRFGGTGLGLAISKRLVEMMDGKIWVESEAGEGSVFIFTVKLVRGESPVEKDARQPAEFTDNFEGRRLLLVEDVEINREIVLSLLEPTRLTIDCATDGAEAVDMFSGAPDRYDMIFMDLQMPRMDGYEATRRIRALDAPKAGTIPIIAMTANVFREDIEKCLENGMNDHVGKPLELDEVLGQLRRYLSS